MKAPAEKTKRKLFTWGGIKVRKFYWSDFFFLGLLYWTAMKGDELTAIVIGISFMIIKLSDILLELMEINAKMKG